MLLICNIYLKSTIHNNIRNRSLKNNQWNQTKNRNYGNEFPETQLPIDLSDHVTNEAI